MYQSNSNGSSWMISLGLFPVPKVNTEPAYVNMGFTEVQKAPIRKEREAEVKKASRAEGRVMRKKMMDELCLLLKTQNIQCRHEAYQIMEEEGFLPIVAQERVMGFARFKDYYTEARRLCGINSFTGSKTEYILKNHKKMSKEQIAENVGCKVHYVSHVIYRSKHTRSKKNGKSESV